MKLFCCIVLIVLANVPRLPAQTNTNAADQILALVTTNPPAAKPPPHPETLIESEGPADFDLAGRRVIYHEHVRVDSSDMKLRCEWLAADLPQTGGRVTNIVAETNVTIDAADSKGQKMHATGDRAVYTYHVQNGETNETVTLTGNARLENAQGWLTGDSIIWDRARDHLSVPSNPKMVFHQNLTGATAGTNASAGGTNATVVETNLPPATPRSASNTNFPPGKLDLVPERHVPPRNN